MSTPADAPTPRNELAWRVLGLVNLYRLLIPPVLIGILYFTQPAAALGASHPRLFVAACILYWLLGGLLAYVGHRHWRSRHMLVLAHTLIDTLAIGTLLYASGGISSGLGILLVIPVGGMALLADRRSAFLIAALASLGILLQQIVTASYGGALSSDYPLAGVMGAVIFLVALSAWPVSNRLRESEALVRRQEIDLANLAQLSQYIVQHLRESILVIDASDRIRLINESAAQVLGDNLAIPDALIGEVSPRLLYLLSTWRQDDTLPASSGAGTFVAADGARVIRPHFAPLGTSERAPVIAFLEDTGAIASKVQQSKLAALGRLSASIAHEIRNPVGAMSHAAQLLAESPALGKEDRRLTEIMQTNAARVSDIVNNVLQLSRRDSVRPQRVALGGWTTRFCDEFCATLQVPSEQLLIDTNSIDVEVRVDSSQLQQILWNLCQNALTHGQRRGQRRIDTGDGRLSGAVGTSGTADGALPPGVVVEIRFGRLPAMGRPYLQVADRGEGIAAADAERIFEPFFTRAARGTGLGLFLARELAQANGATLLYERRDGGGSVFRLVFSDPARWGDADDLNKALPLRAS